MDIFLCHKTSLASFKLLIIELEFASLQTSGCKNKSQEHHDMYSNVYVTKWEFYVHYLKISSDNFFVSSLLVMPISILLERVFSIISTNSCPLNSLRYILAVEKTGYINNKPR